MQELGEHSFFAQCDVSDSASVENLMIKAVEHFGGIDLFVSNAGVLKAGNLHDMTPENFEQVTKINYNGYFLCAKYVSEIMKAEYEADPTKWYDIVQINSKSGLVGSKANFAYAGGKFGGIGLTQSFALELVPWQIKVNSVCPGNYYDGVSVAMVLSGKVPPDYWAGKIVLIGPYAAALQDAYFTSVDKSQPMYGVEIQANLIQSFLEGNFRTELPDLPQLILLFLLCTAAVIYFLRAGAVRGAAACTGLIALYLFIAYILYKSGLIIHLLWLPCCLLLLYLLALVFHYIRAAEERQQLALEKERISTELALASRIQKGALVKDFPPFPERKELL